MMDGPPPRTADNHFVVIGGRRWRATDPDIPEPRRQELTNLLMAWRREVKHTAGTDAQPAARKGVHAAKVALGERGSPPWWEQSDEERRSRWETPVSGPSAR